jgi:Fe-Mn family superoxide dismutase
MFSLPDLPYPYEALQPAMSAETLHFHHDKHHATYVKTLNELLDKAGKSPPSLEEVIAAAADSGEAKLFNNAAQAWNHGFFWNAMTDEKSAPEAGLEAAIKKTFGDFGKLKEAFVTEGAGHFGSGWVWLSAKADGALEIRSTHDAHGMAVEVGVTPLLVCDLWEHAYYLDYQNNRKGYLEAWFDALPNWAFAASQFAAAKGEGSAWRYPEPTKSSAKAA